MITLKKVKVFIFDIFLCVFNCVCVYLCVTLYHAITEVFIYGASNGKKCNHGKWEEYGVSCKQTGDMIECNFDLQNMTLSYMVNGKSQGIAFYLNKDKYYHFVLGMGHKDDSICVKSEKRIIKCDNAITQIHNPGLFFCAFFVFFLFVFVFCVL